MLVWAIAFAYWLVAAVVITYAPPPPPAGSVGSVIGAWSLFGLLPFGFGWALATQTELTGELEQSTTRLDQEQAVRAARAAAEERNRIARELHDVIAHCLSVMVVQTSAARLIADSDVDAAREALAVVESAGRDALVEFRRIVGVLRRDSDEIAGAPTPGVAQLSALADRATAAGLPVSLSIAGSPEVLSAEPRPRHLPARTGSSDERDQARWPGARRGAACGSMPTSSSWWCATQAARRRVAAVATMVPDTGWSECANGSRSTVASYEPAARTEGGFEVHARIPLQGSLSARQRPTVSRTAGSKHG